MLVSVNVDDFQDSIQCNAVCVMWWSSWCLPSLKMLRYLETFDHLYVCTVNVNENPKLVEDFKIGITPCFTFFKNGCIHKQHVGIITIEQIGELLNGCRSSEIHELSSK